MANRYGKGSLFLEYSGIVGTDAIIFIDGRWNNDTAEQHIIERATALRKRSPHITLVGFARTGNSTNRTESLPQYVLDAVNNAKGNNNV